MTHGVLAVFQQAGVAPARADAAPLLEVIIGRVGETQDQTLELLAELILFGEQLQHSFLGLRRIENEIALSHEARARHLPFDRRDKAHCARMQMERPRLALKLEVVDADRFRSQRQIAELLISRV